MNYFQNNFNRLGRNINEFSQSIGNSPVFKKYITHNNQIYPYLLGFFSLILILYGSLAKQQLPNSVYILFNNNIFRLFIIIVIAYTAIQDIRIGIITGLIYVIVMHQYNNNKINKNI